MGVGLAFFVQIFSTGTGCFYGLVSLRFAFYQFAVGLLVLLIICRRGESQLFHITRPTCRKYQLHFVELCVYVFLLCASLSLLGKFRANDFLSDTGVLCQLRTPSTFHILDLVATLSILAVHLVGHHDVIDRIHRRIAWLGLGVQKYVRWLGEVSLKLLDEVPLDLQDQSDRSLQLHKVSAKTTHPLPLSTAPYSANSLLDSHYKKVVETTGDHVHDLSDESPQAFRQRQTTRWSSTFIHKAIRSFGAQVRWSMVRNAIGFRNRSFQDASLLVTILGPAFERIFGSGGLANFQPGVQFPHRGGIARRSSSSIILAVTAVEHKNPVGIAKVPQQGFDFTLGPTVNSYGANLPPSMQLPGILQSTSVKALPDTGSSQNVIDSVFVQTLTPAVTVEPISSPPDKPLVAPDGIIIPCTGKVHLLWAFKGEATVYHLWFYVVESCSHEVVIGNGFLRETETFEEHQERLEINIKPDFEFHPGNLVCEAQDFSCRRLIVSGTINGQSMNATLDTGCEANLMSAEYAKERGLIPILLPGGNQEINFTNGRKASTLGLVEVDWTFDDDPSDVVVKIRCYVLRTCKHSAIFGVQFAVFHEPWEKHRSTLSWKELPDTGDLGVVGLVKEARRFWLFGKKRIGGSPSYGVSCLPY